jgi:hypothetical protein
LTTLPVCLSVRRPCRGGGHRNASVHPPRHPQKGSPRAKLPMQCAPATRPVRIDVISTHSQCRFSVLSNESALIRRVEPRLFAARLRSTLVLRRATVCFDFLIDGGVKRLQFDVCARFSPIRFSPPPKSPRAPALICRNWPPTRQAATLLQNITSRDVCPVGIHELAARQRVKSSETPQSHWNPIQKNFAKWCAPPLFYKKN